MMKQFGKLSVAFLMILSLGVQLKAQKGAVGTAEFVVGKVSVMRADKSVVKLRKGVEFYGGETIVTASASQAKVRLKNGSLVQILPSSKVIINAVKFDGGSDRYAFGVIEGGMNSQVSKLGGKDYYKVYTPTAVAGVRGTEFLVAVGVNGKSNVMVKEGAVALDGSERKDLVKAGEKAEITMDSGIDKEKSSQSDPDKEFNSFMEENKEVEKPAETVSQAAEKMKQIEENNAQRIQALTKKEKLSEDEQDELDFLYQRSVNQSAGLYSLSRNVFQKYKSNPLVKRNFYEVQKRLSSIEDQIADMDAFIEKMSKEIEDFTNDTSQDIDDLEKNFMKRKK